VEANKEGAQMDLEDDEHFNKLIPRREEAKQEELYPFIVDKKAYLNPIFNADSCVDEEWREVCEVCGKHSVSSTSTTHCKNYCRRRSFLLAKDKFIKE